ncbi:MAG: hypothetical protein RLY71_1451 [Pseudomonadota bacterium]|jgi:hypothetical protein
MAGSSVPGPLGTGFNQPQIDAGTAARLASPPPGPLGTQATPPAVGAEQSDPEIEALDLAPTARTAAYTLKKAHPGVKFTSGRRQIADQARAMASNVVKNRRWIEETYKDTPLRKSLQDWVDEHPEQKTQDEIATGLISVFNAATADAVGKFSRHLSGMAFDVQPVQTDAEAIKKTLRSLPGLDLFLDKEGGLERWHAQF